MIIYVQCHNYGPPESRSTVIANRVFGDKAHLSNILNTYIPNNYILIRFGKLSTDEPRPLEIICLSKDAAESSISEFGTARKM